MHLATTAICWIELHHRQISLILLVLICSVFISACANTDVSSLNVTSNNKLIVVKNTEQFSKCSIDTGSIYNNKDSYFVSPKCHFEGRAPDTFTITYSVWYDSEESRKKFFGKQTFIGDGSYFTLEGKKVDRQTWQALAKQNELKAIAQLPESAWQTYTINIKDALKRHKGKTPNGTPEGIVIPIGWGIRLPSFLPWLQDRRLSFDIIIDDDGNVEVEENYSWENVLPDNPYA